MSEPSDKGAQIVDLFEALKAELAEGSKRVPAAECEGGCGCHTVRCGQPDYCCAACPELQGGTKP